MDNILKKFKNIIFGIFQAKEIANSLTDLNKITSSYIDVLKKEVKQKEEKVKRIRVLVQGSVPKEALSSSNLDISLVSVNNIQVKEDGKRKAQSREKWQKEMTKFFNQKKGTVVSGMSMSSQKKGTMVSGIKNIQKLRNKGMLI